MITSTSTTQKESVVYLKRISCLFKTNNKQTNKLELELLNLDLYTLNILIQNYQVILCRGLTIHIFLKLFHNTKI